MSQSRAATLSRQDTPNTLPHDIHCACCPLQITIPTRIFLPAPSRHAGDIPLGETIEFLDRVGWFAGVTPDRKVFRFGMLLLIEQGPGRTALARYDLQERICPDGASRFQLPIFGLEVGHVIWVCPNCEELFKGHVLNVEQYLAEREWAFCHMGEAHFRLVNSFEG